MQDLKSEKKLDYEIETLDTSMSVRPALFRDVLKSEKKLDYEIETELYRDDRRASQKSA